MTSVNSTSTTSTRNYRRPITRTERAILRIKQAQARKNQPAKPVTKTVHTPVKKMCPEKAARLAACMAQIEAQRAAA